MEDVQFNAITFWAGAPNYSILAQMNDTQHNLTVQGYIGATIAVAPMVAVIGETKTLPFVTPNANLSGLKVERAYSGLLGLRYRVSRLVSLDGGVFQMTDFEGNEMTELRVGLNFSLRLDKQGR